MTIQKATNITWHHASISREDRERLLKACEAFACEPWIGIYVEGINWADMYLLSLKRYDEEYRSSKAKAIETWKMSTRYRKRYEQDPFVKHIRIEFDAQNWKWNK